MSESVTPLPLLPQAGTEYLQKQQRAALLAEPSERERERERDTAPGQRGAATGKKSSKPRRLRAKTRKAAAAGTFTGSSESASEGGGDGARGERCEMPTLSSLRQGRPNPPPLPRLPNFSDIRERSSATASGAAAAAGGDGGGEDTATGPTAASPVAAETPRPVIIIVPSSIQSPSRGTAGSHPHHQQQRPQQQQSQGSTSGGSPIIIVHSPGCAGCTHRSKAQQTPPASESGSDRPSARKGARVEKKQEPCPVSADSRSIGCQATAAAADVEADGPAAVNSLAASSIRAPPAAGPLGSGAGQPEPPPRRPSAHHSFFKALMIQEPLLLGAETCSGTTQGGMTARSGVTQNGMTARSGMTQALLTGSSSSSSGSSALSDSIARRPPAPTPAAPNWRFPIATPSDSSSSDSVSELWELERLVEQQHQQLVARGLLPKDDAQSGWSGSYSPCSS